MAGMAGMAVPPHAQLAPGDILVADFAGGEDGAGLLFLVNRVTGDRTVLSDFGNAGQGRGKRPRGRAVTSGMRASSYLPEPPQTPLRADPVSWWRA